MDFDQINEMTGFANGAEFTSTAQVGEYFTTANMAQMFGPSHNLQQRTLTRCAQVVLSNKWHLAENFAHDDDHE